MRKLILLIFAIGLTLGSLNLAYAQNPDSTSTATDSANAAPVEEPATTTEVDLQETAEPEVTGMHQEMKQQFIDGGWSFMALVLVTLIIGLALCIERVVTLNLASTNTAKLLERIEEKLNKKDVAGAMEICKATQGPAATILYEGMSRVDEGADSVEKAMMAYGGVQMGILEKGLPWIGLFIALAPMLGFMGTVIGMIQAFAKIEEVGDLAPDVVAGGIKVALLTTVFGLIVAIILQIFYNYIISKLDSIVNRMDDASINLMDMLIHNDLVKK
jgi:biopolymer transport protein ExbB